MPVRFKRSERRLSIRSKTPISVPGKILKILFPFRTHCQHALLLLYLLVLPQKFTRHCSKFPPSLVPNARSFNAKIIFCGGSVRRRERVSLANRDRVSLANRDRVSLANRDRVSLRNRDPVYGTETLSLCGTETLCLCGTETGCLCEEHRIWRGGLPAPTASPSKVTSKVTRIENSQLGIPNLEFPIWGFSPH